MNGYTGAVLSLVPVMKRKNTIMSSNVKIAKMKTKLNLQTKIKI